MTDPLEVLCPAKINLGLKVLRKRSDGYHDIVTIFQRVTLFDRIRLGLRENSGIDLMCPKSDLPQDEKNIVWRAATEFLRQTGLKNGVSIRLWKHIPVAAGLGGGSSDAAAVLLALNRLCGCPLSSGRLMDLGSGLGADVPFFLMEVPSALGENKGERLSTVRVPWFWLVLVYPGFEVSTQWVYGNLKLELTEPETKHTINNLKQNYFSLDDVFYNDLEKVTIGAYPDIEEIKAQLLSLGSLKALMSGSGPTVFGLFPKREMAVRAWKILSTRNVGQTFVARGF